MTAYADRLATLTAQRGSLCVGIDPHAKLLDSWGLTQDAAGVERFGRTVVEALGQQVAVFKPQVAFFERFGSAGLAALERVLADIRATGALSIADAKRGDIGSTNAGYAAAWLDPASPLVADALTISPYLGFEALRPLLDAALGNGRGVYVLARTSNPEGAGLQLSRDEQGRSVAQQMVDAADAENRRAGTDYVGLVVGATHTDLGCDPTSFTGSLLVPGVGAQGGTIEGVRASFGAAFPHVLASVSRDVLGHGPTAAGLQSATVRLLDMLRAS